MGLYESLASNNPKIAMAIPIVIEVLFLVVCLNRVSFTTFGGIIIGLFAIALGAILAWMCYGLMAAAGHAGIITTAIAFVFFLLTFGTSMHVYGLNYLMFVQPVLFAVPLVLAFRHSSRDTD